MESFKKVDLEESKQSYVLSQPAPLGRSNTGSSKESRDTCIQTLCICTLCFSCINNFCVCLQWF